MRNLKKKPIQIYVEPRQHNILEAMSKKKGISKAAIIREGIEKFLKELPVEDDPAMGLMGLGNSGKGDMSDRHDKYLAGYVSSRKK
jgi:hypothetical protein